MGTLARPVYRCQGDPSTGVHSTSGVVGSSSVHGGLAFRQRHAQTTGARSALPDLQLRHASLQDSRATSRAVDLRCAPGVESEAFRFQSSLEPSRLGHRTPPRKETLSRVERVRVKDP